MKLKLISDGTAPGTRLFNKESGETIGCIENVKWEMDAKDHFAKVTITLLNVEVEISQAKIS